MVKVDLFRGDCRHVEIALPVNALITDPPYGIKLKTNYRERKRGNLAECNDYPPMVGDDAPFDPTPWMRYPAIVLFGANNYADKLPPSSGWIIWDKRDGMTPNDGADCEMIYTNQHCPARIYRHLWNGMLKASEREERRVHPTQKPVALCRWIVTHYTRPGDTILDPYMGSGSIGVACVLEGRNYIGIEIEERYFVVASQRIEAARMQERML